MKKDTNAWLVYAEENLASAEILLQSRLFNPCLQNVQQSVEKFLKAVIIEKAAGLTRTHSIRQLSENVINLGIYVSLSDDDIDLLDSIYLPVQVSGIQRLAELHAERRNMQTLCKYCHDGEGGRTPCLWRRYSTGADGSFMTC